jgi:hypothetical protein
MVQNFKGDSTELKMQAVVDPLFEVTNAALDDFNEGGYDAAPFLLAMYDDGRMPFSQRVKREYFVEFVRQILANFPFTGTFEVYLRVLEAIFGVDSEISFTVPAPGKLSIDIEAVANSTFTFIGREFVSGAFEFFDIGTSGGDTIILRGVSGIDTAYELNLLFSEVMPIGVVPNITLGFYEISDWVNESNDFMVDEDDLGIIFVEGGV